MSQATPYLIALDQGTTSSRSMVFDTQGQPVHVSQKEFTQHYPNPGWVEHDANEIWHSQRDTLLSALKEGPAAATDIAAIGITNQRETTVVWDRQTGKPIHAAIVWQDRRTADTCAALTRAGHDALVRERTGLRLDPYFSGTKLAWILDHVDGARKRAEDGELCFGTIDTWLLWNLTDGQVHATDPSNASRTLLFNIHTGSWDDNLLELLNIPRSVLPEVRPSSGDFGQTAGGELPEGIPIRGIAGDQHAALFGQTCFAAGEAKNTYGTGCFLLMNTGTEAVASSNNLLTTVAWDLGEGLTYALEGSVFIGGAVVQWLRDELQLISSAAECSELAASVDDAGGLILVPAFAGLGAPHWDPHARGLALGMTRGTTRAHWCRAALEGIAFQSAELFEAMQQDAPSPPDRALRVDGGATASVPLMQFQADLLQRDLHRPAVTETTARGAALLAGLGAGIWDTPDDLLDLQAEQRTVFSPKQSAATMQEKFTRWKAAVERCKGWENA